MKQGKVILVGAGCGRDLITLAGLKELKKAQSVVYDDLIDLQLLQYLPEGCRKIYVGKRSGQHSKKQEEINQILIDEAKAGYRVVRLKGGDSIVFGRGGEEILALQEEDIPYRLIPGVTSSVAVPESLGIPVTHRKVARSFSVITGHTADNDPAAEKARWDALSKVDGTLVFLMGLGAAGKISEGLMGAGMDPYTPAAILSRGYAPDTARIDGNLASLAQMAESALTPAIIVVGDVAGLHMEATDLGQFTGTSVTVTGTDFFAKKLGDALEEQGAYVNRYAYVKLEAKPEEIPDYAGTQSTKTSGDSVKIVDKSQSVGNNLSGQAGQKWLVFTSSNGIRIFFENLRERKTDLRSLMTYRFACIGAGTAQTLQDYGFTADLMPEEYTAQALGDKLAAELAGQEGVYLDILRASNGSPLLTEALDGAGISYEDHKIYDTIIDEDRLPMTDIDTDWIVFASAYGAKGFFEQADEDGLARIQHLKERVAAGQTRIICIGQITAAAVEEHLPEVDADKMVVAKKHTVEGILDLML